MRFLRDALITIVVLAAVVLITAYFRIRAGGLAADAEPGRVERAVATRLARLSIPSDAKQQTNPFQGDPTTWRSAADHFGDHCAGCHGNDGHGQTVMGQNMYPRTADLAASAVQRLSDGELFYVIQNGVRWTGMPAWKREHSAEDSWRLVSFVRALPHLTRDDLESAGLGAAADTDHHHREHEHGGEEHHPGR